jgi:hypothetical protein
VAGFLPNKCFIYFLPNKSSCGHNMVQCAFVMALILLLVLKILIVLVVVFWYAACALVAYVTVFFNPFWWLVTTHLIYTIDNQWIPKTLYNTPLICAYWFWKLMVILRPNFAQEKRYEGITLVRCLWWCKQDNVKCILWNAYDRSCTQYKVKETELSEPGVSGPKSGESRKRRHSGVNPGVS